MGGIVERQNSGGIFILFSRSVHEGVGGGSQRFLVSYESCKQYYVPSPLLAAILRATTV